jgi:hypothetical protein
LYTLLVNITLHYLQVDLFFFTILFTNRALPCIWIAILWMNKVVQCSVFSVQCTPNRFQACTGLMLDLDTQINVLSWGTNFPLYDEWQCGPKAFCEPCVRITMDSVLKTHISKYRLFCYYSNLPTPNMTLRINVSTWNLTL